eukprot:2959039-Amphidinium_carterae.1
MKHDALILGVVSPWALEFLEYNWEAAVGLSAQGKRTALIGSEICLHAPRGVGCEEEAWEHRLRQKFQCLGTQVASYHWSHEMWRRADITHHMTNRSRADMAYCDEHDPCRNMHAGTRGNCLAAFCRWYDVSLGGYFVAAALPSTAVNGSQLGCNQRPHDYTRAAHGEPLRRVEVKSARLCWTRSRWDLRFQGLKLDSFDDLLLVVYLPWGLEVLEMEAH